MSSTLAPVSESGIIQWIRDWLARMFPNYFPLFGSKSKEVVSSTGMKATLIGFACEKIGDSGQTTTWQRTGQSGTDFHFFPYLNLTPDINGSFRIDWSYNNKFPDGAQAVIATGIVNQFPELIAGQQVTLKLVDTRDPASSGRDPTRGGAIAIGDKDFAGFGIQDGIYHSFHSDVTVKITSPTGATLDLSGTLNEYFKSVGSLSGSLVPFNVEIVP